MCVRQACLLARAEISLGRIFCRLCAAFADCSRGELLWARLTDRSTTPKNSLNAAFTSQLRSPRSFDANDSSTAPLASDQPMRLTLVDNTYIETCSAHISQGCSLPVARWQTPRQGAALMPQRMATLSRPYSLSRRRCYPQKGRLRLREGRESSRLPAALLLLAALIVGPLRQRGASQRLDLFVAQRAGIADRFRRNLPNVFRRALILGHSASLFARGWTRHVCCESSAQSIPSRGLSTVFLSLLSRACPSIAAVFAPARASCAREGWGIMGGAPVTGLRAA